MERMLAVVFDDEIKTREGVKALGKLDSDGDISIYAEAVISKNKDGTVTMSQAADAFPVDAVSGSAVGALVGLLGGPLGSCYWRRGWCCCGDYRCG